MSRVRYFSSTLLSLHSRTRPEIRGMRRAWVEEGSCCLVTGGWALEGESSGEGDGAGPLDSSMSSPGGEGGGGGRGEGR